MLLALLFLAGSPAPLPTPAVIRTDTTPREIGKSVPEKSLAGTAGKIKLNRNVSFGEKAAPTPVKPKGAPNPLKQGGGGDPSGAIAELAALQQAEAKAAQARMDEAVEKGRAAHRNDGMSDGAKADARYEWDTAAEACRKVPGCNPYTRDASMIPTREYIVNEIKKRGFSENPR